MKPLFAFFYTLLLAALGVSAPAAESSFYIGTMTDRSDSKGIYMGSINTETGKLNQPVLAGEASNPSFIALPPNGRFLYAVAENREGAVVAFRIEPGGMLARLNEQSSGGAGPCHVWVDATGGNVFAANYGGGSVACIRTQSDGSLGQRTALVAFAGSGPKPGRQKKPFAHSIYSDPSNRFAYCCDLGSDSVWILKFDAAKGTLSPETPPSGKVPPGSGPRHLAMSGDGRFVYVCNEMGLSVTAFTRNGDTGGLDPFQTEPTSLLAGASPETFTTSEICLHPTGKWLYVSNRDGSNGGRDSFAVFSIAEDGRLAQIETIPAQVKTPRSFAIDPTGKWLVAAGQADNRIAVFKIDPKTGALNPTDQTAKVPAPVCVLFAPGTGKL